jgi:hypothetical protein
MITMSNEFTPREYFENKEKCKVTTGIETDEIKKKERWRNAFLDHRHDSHFHFLIFFFFISSSFHSISWYSFMKCITIWYATYILLPDWNIHLYGVISYSFQFNNLLIEPFIVHHRLHDALLFGAVASGWKLFFCDSGFNTFGFMEVWTVLNKFYYCVRCENWT